MQDAPKAVWSIPYVSIAFFLSLNQNFIAYSYSKLSSHPDCIFESHQLWQLGFSRVYSKSFCSCSFEPEIIKNGQSSHKMYSNKILNYQEPTIILNPCTKMSGNLLKAPRNSATGIRIRLLLFIWNCDVTAIEVKDPSRCQFYFSWLAVVSFRIQCVKIPTQTLRPRIALTLSAGTYSHLLLGGDRLSYTSRGFYNFLESSRQFYDIRKTGSAI